ncbi:uncharacterized protein [Haliotis asinina]|uniref:uncharacterized protein n=1 Tax=Haliotis asinina TaxID=109174 RepID=UPI0035320E8F
MTGLYGSDIESYPRSRLNSGKLSMGWKKDSLSAIQSLATEHSSGRPDTIHEILVLIQKLRQENEKEVTLCWIPSHVGIPGNERADKLARQALELNVSLEHPYSKSEIRSMIQNSITSKWQRLWNTSDKGK